MWYLGNISSRAIQRCMFHPNALIHSKCAHITLNIFQKSSFPLYHLNQSFNFLAPTNNLIVPINSYHAIYILFQTNENSWTNCYFYILPCFTHRATETTAINMYSTPLECSHQALSNGIYIVHMRPAVKNATRIEHLNPGKKYRSAIPIYASRHILASTF